MNSIISFLRRLLGFEKSIEKITAPMTRIVTSLEEYAAEQKAAAEADEAKAAELKNKASAEKKCAAEAEDLVGKYSAFMPGKTI